MNHSEREIEYFLILNDFSGIIISYYPIVSTQLISIERGFYGLLNTHSLQWYHCLFFIFSASSGNFFLWKKCMFPTRQNFFYALFRILISGIKYRNACVSSPSVVYFDHHLGAEHFKVCFFYVFRAKNMKLGRASNDIIAGNGRDR